MDIIILIMIIIKIIIKIKIIIIIIIIIIRCRSRRRRDILRSEKGSARTIIQELHCPWYISKLKSRNISYKILNI